MATQPADTATQPADTATQPADTATQPADTGLWADAFAGAGTQVVDVVGGGTGCLGGVGQHAQIACGGQSALVRIQHVQPRQHRAVHGLNSQSDLVVESELPTLPLIESRLV